MRGVAVVDLDDTLIPDVAAARTAIGSVLAQLAVSETTEAIDTTLICARSAWRANPYRDHAEFLRVSSWEALWLDIPALDTSPGLAAAHRAHRIGVWRSALAELGGDESLAEEADRIFPIVRGELVRPFPGVVAQLRRLARHHTLWLATDGGRLQRVKLRLSGLTGYFSRVFVSAEMARAKADPEFASALRLAAAADEVEVCVVIGDSVTSDIQPAAAAGWSAVHVCGAASCPAEPIVYRVFVEHCPTFADLSPRSCQHF